MPEEKKCLTGCTYGLISKECLVCHKPQAEEKEEKKCVACLQDGYKTCEDFAEKNPGYRCGCECHDMWGSPTICHGNKEESPTPHSIWEEEFEFICKESNGFILWRSASKLKNRFKSFIRTLLAQKEQEAYERGKRGVLVCGIKYSDILGNYEKYRKKGAEEERTRILEALPESKFPDRDCECEQCEQSRGFNAALDEVREIVANE